MRSIPSAQVLVVGGGPAGSVTALLLARAGVTVSLVDRARFPRPKPCGECLNPGAVAALNRLHLLQPVLGGDPATIEGWELRTASGERAVGRFGAHVGHGLGIPRSVLDGILLQEARRAGVHVYEGERVVDVQLSSPGRWTATITGSRSQPVETTVSVLVGADGLRSVVSRRTGMLARSPRLRKVSRTFHVRGISPADVGGVLLLEDGMTLGAAPVRRDRDLWNCTIVVMAGPGAKPLATHPHALLSGALERLGDGGAGRAWEVVGGPWASGPFDWPTRRAAGGGIFLVGDAAGYFDPFTGQGIFRALRSAELAAPAIARALDEPRELHRASNTYDRTLGREFGPSRWLQRAVEATLSRPRLREGMVKRLSICEGALDALIRVTGDASSPGRLTHPGFWLPLLLPLVARPVHRQATASASSPDADC